MATKPTEDSDRLPCETASDAGWTKTGDRDFGLDSQEAWFDRRASLRTVAASIIFRGTARRTERTGSWNICFAGRKAGRSGRTEWTRWSDRVVRFGQADSRSGRETVSQHLFASAREPGSPPEAKSSFALHGSFGLKLRLLLECHLGLFLSIRGAAARSRAPVIIGRRCSSPIPKFMLPTSASRLSG